MTFLYGFNPEQYNVHQMVVDIIEPKTRVLDLGCATGYLARELIKKNCQVWGIDNDSKALTKAKKYCSRTLLFDLEEIKNINDLPTNYFDYILILDTVEHLRNPQDLLANIKKFLRRDGKIVISFPNIVTLQVRLSLLLGNFEYGNYGTLDKTHLRFFTKKSFSSMVKRANFKIIATDHNADLGILPLIGRVLKRLPRKVQYLITKTRPTLLATQFIFVCRPK